MTENEQALADAKIEAEIAKIRAETARLQADEKFRAEVSKLIADTASIKQKVFWYPTVLLFGAAGAGAAVAKLFSS